MTNMAFRPHCAFILFSALILLTGCNAISSFTAVSPPNSAAPPPTNQEVWEVVKKNWNWFLEILSIKNEPIPIPSKNPTIRPSPSSPHEVSAAKKALQNAQLLHEIFLITFNREPLDRSDFGNWADTLNQGASLEGVFNGLTHSTAFRQIETEHAGASTTATRIFGEELAILESSLLSPTFFNQKSTLPLPLLKLEDPENPTTPSGPVNDPENPTTVIEFPGPSAVKPAGTGFNPPPIVTEYSIPISAAGYTKLFIGASIFTLKRVLGEEALKVVSAQNSYPEKRALWYSKWVVRIVNRKVEFGLPLRNSSDENFHYRWALANSEDKLKWEVLNRLFRVLNEANKETP
jgi:hypothetical protein